LAGIKQEVQNSDVEIFNLRKLNELEVMKEYQINISNRFADLGNVNNSNDILRTWKSIKKI
jgi:hypothetical protein